MAQPYRTDRDALESRLTSLEEELEALRTKKRELADAVKSEEELAREADTLRRRLLKDRRSLPLLDSVRVASPCKADWDAMSGDDTVRFCGGCQKNVYDLSSMTREDAERFVREREGAGACIRMHRRKDGTLLTSDCPVGARAQRTRRAVGAIAGGVGLLGAGLAWMNAATTTMGDMQVEAGLMEVTPQPPEKDVVMGDMEVAPPPEPSVQPKPPVVKTPAPPVSRPR
jgi:hypothetical protein